MTLAGHRAELAARVRALGDAPAAEDVFRVFAAWCRAVPPVGAHDRAWLSVEHLLPEGAPDAPGERPCAVRLVREGVVDGAPEAVGITLWYPLTPAVRAWLDDPGTEGAWWEPPGRADRLWGRFRTTLAPRLGAWSPRVEAG